MRLPSSFPGSRCGSFIFLSRSCRTCTSSLSTTYPVAAQLEQQLSPTALCKGSGECGCSTSGFSAGSPSGSSSSNYGRDVRPASARTGGLSTRPPTRPGTGGAGPASCAMDSEGQNFCVFAKCHHGTDRCPFPVVPNGGRRRRALRARAAGLGRFRAQGEGGVRRVAHLFVRARRRGTAAIVVALSTSQSDGPGLAHANQPGSMFMLVGPQESATAVFSQPLASICDPDLFYRLKELSLE